MWDQFAHWEKRRRLFVQEPLTHYENISSSLNFTGLSCRSNRPFRFLAIDPVHIPHFTKLALGFNLETDGSRNGSTRTDMGLSMKDPLAFIIDAQVISRC